MKKHILAIGVLIAGFIGAILRCFELNTGFEVDTGLFIKGNVFGILSKLLLAVVVAAVILTVRNRIKTQNNFDFLSIQSSGLLGLEIVAAGLMAVSGVINFMNFIDTPTYYQNAGEAGFFKGFSFSFLIFAFLAFFAAAAIAAVAVAQKREHFQENTAFMALVPVFLGLL